MANRRRRSNRTGPLYWPVMRLRSVRVVAGSLVLLGSTATLSACGGTGDQPLPSSQVSTGETVTAPDPGPADPWGRDRPLRLARAASAVASQLQSCRALALADVPASRGILHTSASGWSLTIRVADGWFACDRTEILGELPGGWCGSAHGQLVDGELRDPRLSFAGCMSRRGKPVGFAWVSAPAGTAFVVVDQGTFVERYPTRGGAPVRISSRRLDALSARLRLRVAFFERDGTLIRRAVLDARVSG